MRVFQMLCLVPILLGWALFWGHPMRTADHTIINAGREKGGNFRATHILSHKRHLTLASKGEKQSVPSSDQTHTWVWHFSLVNPSHKKTDTNTQFSHAIVCVFLFQISTSDSTSDLSFINWLGGEKQLCSFHTIKINWFFSEKAALRSIGQSFQR